jgi:hypothetical protein
LATVTPTTWKSTFLMRIVWPIGSVPPVVGEPNRSSRAVGPRTATRAALVTCSAVTKEPSAICRFRTVGYTGSVPMTCVLVLVPRPTIWYRLDCSGATACARGARDEATAAASAGVSVRDDPRPALKPPAPRDTPGVTKSRFEPMDWMLASMLFLAPCPMATNAMTEAMPMTIPSTVSPDRTLLTVRARNDSCRTSVYFITRHHSPQQPPDGGPPVR